MKHLRNITERESSFFKEEVVSSTVNSVNATPNPVVEGDTITIMTHKKKEEKKMKSKLTNKRGGRWVMAIIAMLLMINLATALEVKTFNEELFEIDAFAQGEKIVILAEAETQPLISIEGSEIQEKEMPIIEQGKYQAIIQIMEEGEYEITVKENEKTDSTTVFIVKGLNINWEEAQAQLDSDKAEREKIKQEAEQAIAKMQDEKDSFWNKIKNFVEEMWEWMFEGVKNESR